MARTWPTCFGAALFPWQLFPAALQRAPAVGQQATYPPPEVVAAEIVFFLSVLFFFFVLLHGTRDSVRYGRLLGRTPTVPPREKAGRVTEEKTVPRETPPDCFDCLGRRTSCVPTPKQPPISVVAQREARRAQLADTTRLLFGHPICLRKKGEWWVGHRPGCLGGWRRGPRRHTSLPSPSGRRPSWQRNLPDQETEKSGSACHSRPSVAQPHAGSRDAADSSWTRPNTTVKPPAAGCARGYECLWRRAAGWRSSPTAPP